MSSPTLHQRSAAGLLGTSGRLAGRIADLAGHFAALIMILLTISVTLGVILRLVGIDNSWTYDLDLFTLIWLAFFGAAFTSLRNGHVTSGVALEHMLGGHRAALALATVRFLIVAVFLVVFAYSSFNQALTSYTNHETTLDIIQWPVWVAKASLPLGAVCWLAAEIHKFLARLAPAR
ncbi:TRAP transporter small permease [Salinisphaera sp. T31B1]|uniref:TRAP transporter small permease n=1 Tax=Salinisphaera sp. T31B1 TaxID=727963 RepID=UPI003340D7D9